MKIVSLEPFITETVHSFGLESSLVGVGARCEVAQQQVLRVSARVEREKLSAEELAVSNDKIDFAGIRALEPEVVLCSVRQDENSDGCRAALAYLHAKIGVDTKVYSYFPRTLDGVHTFFRDLAGHLEVAGRGVEISSRFKAQCMDWCDNFYPRMKNKRVSFLSSLEPIKMAGWWLPELILLASAQSQSQAVGAEPMSLSWQDLVDYRPDVIVVAPEGSSLSESMAFFERLERLPGWEEIPAVKRGEVIFTSGKSHFYQASPKLLDGVAILISAIAGFESGYITPRDSFKRLRWLELHRDKISAQKGAKKR